MTTRTVHSTEPSRKTDSNRPRIGVLALQGDVREHLRALADAGADAVAVRRPSELDEVVALVIPGGEQRTEDSVGPYALQDFNLYHVLRRGYRPSKIAFLAHHAWGEGEGAQDLATIKKWLEVFVRRFFSSQFKRSALPNGPKVSPGGTMSPRGDWRMPSDASNAAWLADLENIPD